LGGNADNARELVNADNDIRENADNACPTGERRELKCFKLVNSVKAAPMIGIYGFLFTPFSHER